MLVWDAFTWLLALAVPVIILDDRQLNQTESNRSVSRCRYWS